MGFRIKRSKEFIMKSCHSKNTTQKSCNSNRPSNGGSSKRIFPLLGIVRVDNQLMVSLITMYDHLIKWCKPKTFPFVLNLSCLHCKFSLHRTTASKGNIERSFFYRMQLSPLQLILFLRFCTFLLRQPLRCRIFIVIRPFIYHLRSLCNLPIELQQPFLVSLLRGQIGRRQWYNFFDEVTAMGTISIPFSFALDSSTVEAVREVLVDGAIASTCDGSFANGW